MEPGILFTQRQWLNLWHEIDTAEWVANTGLPLTMTLLGIVGAAWLVRRQIRHDRDLARAQRRAERSEDIADRLDAAVGPLIQLRMHDESWLEMQGLERVAERLSLYFGDDSSEQLRNFMDWIRKCKADALDVVRHLADEGSGPAKGGQFYDTATQEAAWTIIMGERFVPALREYGRRLHRWDGLGRAPDFGEFDGGSGIGSLAMTEVDSYDATQYWDWAVYEWYEVALQRAATRGAKTRVLLLRVSNAPAPASRPLPER